MVTWKKSVLLRSSAWASVLSALCILFSLAAAAQTTGTIYGQVLDASGAVVPEASITATNTGTGSVWKGASNSAGSYVVPSLPPGPYKVTVERSGFKTYVQSGITVIVGENARVDAKLEVGTVNETVQVAAGAVAVDTQSTTVGTTVDNQRIESMPLNGRNVLALTQLLPGVGTADFSTQTFGGRGEARVSISGSRNTENNMMLDGTPMVNQMYNDETNLPSPDALQEFRVLTNTFSAEYGRASGGVFLAVTKSGTNNFHGSLFEYLRNDALNARNYFAPAPTPKPFLRQNQFGGNIGGPIRFPGYNGKDRTFFFFNYQGTRIRQQYLDIFFPPSAQERQGIFATPITDPNTGQPFPNNTIPQDRFDPLAVGIMNTYFPLPNTADGSYKAWVPQPTNGNDYTAKVDHQLTKANHLSFRFFRNDAKQNTVYFGDALSSNLAGKGTNLVQTEDLKWTAIITPRLLNEATLSHLRMKTTYVPPSGGKSPKDLGGNFNYDGPFPLLPNAYSVGRFNFGPVFLYQEPEESYHFSDKLTWTHGRHTINVGTQMQLRAQHLTVASFVSAGSFTFSGSFTGDPLADYLLGAASNNYAQSFIEDLSRSSNYHFYGQDDFKINRRLTLNLGLRYEYVTPWVQVHDHTGTVIPGRQSTKFPTAPPGLMYPGDPGVPRGLYPATKDDLGPRIGLAWDPTGTGRTAIRSSFAMYTEYVGAIMSSVNNQTEPFLVPISQSPPHSFSDPYDVAHGGVDPFPYTVNYTNPTFFFPMQAFSIARNFRDGYVEQWNLNIQHQFGPSVLLKAGYYGLEGHHLSNLREANQAIFGPGATEANAQSRRPFFPQYYGSIAESISDANSDYHSLQVGVDKKFGHGYTLQLAYTFSKSIDNASLAQVDAVNCQDGNNCGKGERGLSDYDQRHIFAVNGIWQLPFMKGNRFLGGWQLAGITRVTSGSPFSILSGLDQALVGGGRSAGSQRADRVGNWRLDPNRSHQQLVAEYFNTAAFALPQLGTFGNSGRNIVIGPGYSQTNASLQKKFKLPGERGDIEFRADVFNLFNQVNFSTLGGFGPSGLSNVLESPAFGQLQYARDARIVQLALRYDF